MEVGSGHLRYRVEPDWPQLPESIELGDVAGVAVDSDDRVYVFNRGEHPMVVLDREGALVDVWGEGMFNSPHGVHIGPDGCVYCTDDGFDVIRKCTLQGQLLMTIGVPGRRAPFMSGLSFCRCTHAVLSPTGDIYVSDGYGNPRIHRYAPDGRLIGSWGESGTGPGEFNLPHNICCDPDGMIYVADRENHRVQVFDRSGGFVSQWGNLHRPSALCAAPGGQSFFVGEIGPYYRYNRGAPNLGPRITVMNRHGAVLTRLGQTPAAGTEPGQLLSPHGLAVDSRGDLYIGDVATRGWRSLFPDEPQPTTLRRLHKFTWTGPLYSPASAGGQLTINPAVANVD
jgi:DNA-binding beta-propeller fold protein YncE